jgi:hypothetical protein
MRTIVSASAMLVLIAATGGPVRADVVEVVATGTVEFNQVNPAPLGNVMPGDPVTMRFTVDSNTFTDGATFPVRGYDIDQASFTLELGTTTMTLQAPFPAGQTPYFSIRNDDPAVDGFFVSTNIEFPVGVPINQTGIFEQFLNDYSVTYSDDPLDSLDILDALGSYDFTGLSVFNWTINDGPFNPVGIVFVQLTISRQSSSFCDDADGSLASCPCANPGAPDTGCDIQQGTGGVGLNLVAQQTVLLNRVTWGGSGFPAMSTPAAIVIRAADLDSAAPVVFGDGLRCIGTPLVRLGAAFAIGGTSVHTHGHGAMAGTGAFHYQLWFRNTPIMFCDPAAAFNLSNGYTLVW